MSDHLNLAKLALFQRQYEQITAACDRAISFYTSESLRLKLAHTNTTWRDGPISDVNSVGVEITWEDYYDSRDHGKFYIPWNALADDTYKDTITALVTKQVEKQTAEEEAKRRRELSQKIAQLQRLKAELGDTNV